MNIDYFALFKNALLSVTALLTLLWANITRADIAYVVGLIVATVSIISGVTTIIKNIKEGKLLDRFFKNKKK